MATTEDHPAGRIRERPAKPMWSPWTYRCYLSRREPGIDVDAFTQDEARALAASHRSVKPSEMDLEGRRRQAGPKSPFMRTGIGNVAKYDPLGDYLAKQRGGAWTLTHVHIEEILGAEL